MKWSIRNSTTHWYNPASLLQNESFRERPQVFKDVSYLAGGFKHTFSCRLPNMENNYLLCGVVVKVLEEKKTYTPPPPLYYIKKVEQ